ncbi:DUF2312 domain-containing protein [Rhodovulum visakhapatnamense]|uniref:DUF2312 domain-containing protein n=2 Tax=Paracoccaceae TaxID=31989 RepID=A0ABS1RFM4_9RHOB|nr:DUF2312 domain-containing protein [Rhodovulum visakhapatnamense]MBL3578383.1 DUF2312 domain-containing protein [Rhodovulum visakhapatnamense]
MPKDIDDLGADLAGADDIAVDPLMLQAAQHVVKTRKASTSGLQSVLRVGYNRAARLMEALEAEGIVTPADHVGHREVAVDALPFSLAVLVDTQEAADAVVASVNSSAKGRMKESPEDVEVRDRTYRVAAGELRGFIERFEKLAQEKAEITDQQAAVMAEAKGRGYDTKVLRRIIALRKRDANDVAEEEAVMALYREALGM